MQNRSDKSLFGIDINEYSQGVDFTVLATTIDFYIYGLLDQQLVGLELIESF